MSLKRVASGSTSRVLKQTRLLPSRIHRYYSTPTSSNAPEDSDVVIVGGGPAGLALASALGSSDAVKQNLKITLVEFGDLEKVRGWNMPSDAFSNRVSSLTNVSQNFLEEIGAWDLVDEGRTCGLEEMKVWDGISDARIDFNAATLGLGSSMTAGNQMARLTENLNLQRGLLRHLDQHTNVSLLDNTKVDSIHHDGNDADGWPAVHLSNGKVLRARLLVGADGFNSPVRSYAGIESYGWNYPTHAIVATLQHAPRSLQPNTTAYQRFLPTGPIAFLPLSPTASSLVWSTRPALAAALKQTDPLVLVRMINAAFRLPEVSLRYLHDRILEASTAGAPLTPSEITDEIAWRERAHDIHEYSAYASASVDPVSVNIGIPPEGAELLPPLVENIQPGTVASFPLRFNHAEAYVGEGRGARTVLVGDAAHTIHPLAGQGLNLGLGDAECLARCITGAVQRGGDIGSHTALLPYARERYFENHKMMSAVDKLHKLYASTAPPVVWARSVGVEVLNELDALKAGVMASAGAGPGPGRGDASWGMAASGVEALVGGARVVTAVRDGVRAVGVGALQQLAQSLAGRSR